jgi:hypothetical protein
MTEVTSRLPEGNDVAVEGGLRVRTRASRW